MKLTWRAKATPILAFDGGVGAIVRAFFEENGLLEYFITMVDRDYQLMIPLLEGENLNFYLPTVSMNSSGARFKSCSNISYAAVPVANPKPTAKGNF